MFGPSLYQNSFKFWLEISFSKSTFTKSAEKSLCLVGAIAETTSIYYLVCCCKIKIVKNRILQLFWKTLWRKTSPSKFIWLLLQRFFCVKNCRFWFNLLRFVMIVGDHNFCRFLMDNFKTTCLVIDGLRSYYFEIRV